VKHTTWSALIFAAAVTGAVPSTSDAKQYVAHGTMVSGPAAVRVWVEGGDVFPDYNHVTLWVRPERDCYTSLFLVDTAGFIHVLDVATGYNGSNSGWLYGGRTYGYRACDLGLDRLDGRGIAYVFAVGSPVPFNYSYYGASVYVGGFGFRIVGDPFVGCREFYMSLLPASCHWDYVGVAYTRFYVRDWVRYPSYLCVGGHVRVGDRCSQCEPVYATYRCNLAAPYEAMRPVVRYKDNVRYSATVHHVVRGGDRHEPIREQSVRIKTRETVRVVSTSRDVNRGPQLEKSRTDVRVAARGQSTGNENAMVAYKERGQKHSSLVQNSHEKGARKKVRQAK
jgi:hypothetical protein